MITYNVFDKYFTSYFISTPIAVARIDLGKHDSSQVYSHNDYSNSFFTRYPDEVVDLLSVKYRLVAVLFEDCYAPQGL